MFHLWYFHLFTYIGFQHDFNFKYCSCGLTITRRLILVEQELLTHPGHLSSSPIFSRVRVVLSLGVLCSVLWIINCPLVLFHLAIVLSVFRFMASDYLFGVFKLFFSGTIEKVNVLHRNWSHLYVVFPYRQHICRFKRAHLSTSHQHSYRKKLTHNFNFTFPT
jgi:hypothetical protein